MVFFMATKFDGLPAFRICFLGVFSYPDSAVPALEEGWVKVLKSEKRRRREGDESVYETAFLSAHVMGVDVVQY